MKMDVLRCLVVSPGDCTLDREAAVRAIEAWNAHIGSPDGRLIHPVRWETHSTPDFGKEPQAILNRQIVDSCDFAVAIFWSRLGTPTSSSRSGSVEEIERMVAAGKRVLLYVCTRPFEQKYDTDQVDALREFLSEIRAKALYIEYGQSAELTPLLMGHLSSALANAVPASQLADQQVAAQQGGATATGPEVRVKTTFALPTGLGSPPPVLLAVTCQNHSQRAVRIGAISIRTSARKTLQPTQDFAGRSLEQPIIEAGDSYQWLLDFADLVSTAERASETMECAVVRDKLDNEYSSDPDEMVVALANFLGWTERSR